MSATSPLVRTRSLRKAYEGAVAVDDVSIDVDAGKIVGLVGKNGAGKSSLIKLLAGALSPDSGEIEIDGEPVTFERPQDALHRGIAVMYQELEQVPLLSVAENVMLGARYPTRAGVFVNRRAMYLQAEAALSQLDVSLDPRTPIDDLSVAQKRLVMIARALHQRARLLILDEPTTSLTGAEIDHLFAVCKAHRDRGGSVLYVTHRLEEIFALCDDVVVMRDGRVVLTDRISGVKLPDVVAAITGRHEIATAPERRLQRAIGGRPPTPTILEAQNLASANGARGPRVHDLSFELREGEILGLAGLVGSGRTEVARMLFGADPRGGGEILVRGRPVPVGTPRDAMQAGIVLLPEDRRFEGLLLDFSLRENISLPSLSRFRWARLPVPSRKQERSVARTMIERLGMRTRGEDESVRTLSGGTQQKVVVGKWLVQNADVMIFDEPTAGIDVEAKDQIYEIMEAAAADGRGIIFISSEFGELVAVCHRVLVLCGGELAGELEGDAIHEAQLVELCYADTSSGDVPVEAVG